MTQRVSHFFCLSLILFGATFFYAPSVKAQTNTKASTAEDVTIAFYKTGNIVPNFKDWIKEREPYRSTPLGRRPQIMGAEINRLSQKYKAFDTQQNLITVKTSATLQPIEMPNGQNQSDYILNISLNDHKDVLYFPYEFLNQNIMMIPNNFDKAKAHIISKTQFTHIQSHLRKDKRNTLIIRLKADKADFKHPYMVDNLAQWSFKTNIASMAAWTDDDILIWEYTAPWHMSPQQQQMRQLYQNRPNQINKNGVQKPVTNFN